MPTPPRVLALALRSSEGGPMREVAEAASRPEGWLDGDHGGSQRRGVTLLSQESWAAACRACAADLPWHTRRANVLVEGLALLPLIGREVRVGGLRLRIEGETVPCRRMEEASPGLQAALVPEGRGGVYGRVLDGGSVRIGDSVEVLPADATGDDGGRA